MGKLKVSYIEEKDLDLIYRLYKHFATFERMEDYHTASPSEIGKMVFEEKLLHILKAEIDGEIVSLDEVTLVPQKRYIYL